MIDQVGISYSNLTTHLVFSFATYYSGKTSNIHQLHWYSWMHLPKIIPMIWNTSGINRMVVRTFLIPLGNRIELFFVIFMTTRMFFQSSWNNLSSSRTSVIKSTLSTLSEHQSEIMLYVNRKKMRRYLFTRVSWLMFMWNRDTTWSSHMTRRPKIAT